MAGLAGAFGAEQTQEARLVLVHELVHALQDQRLGLGESYEKERTADGDNAFRAIVEGDATLAMLAHALRQQGIPLSAATAGIQQMGDYLDLNALVRGEKLDDAPAILRVTLVAPYLRGLQFVAAVQGRGGWPAVNNAHRRAPTTTEQVLHPEKYFAREQLELSVYLGQRQPSGTDDEAAAGWAGDLLVVYARGEEAAVIWWTTWDTDADAEEAFRAARSVSPRDSTSRVERKGRSVGPLRPHRAGPAVQAPSLDSRRLHVVRPPHQIGLIVRGLPSKLHRSIRGDFTSFARRIKSEPAPPEVRPDLVY
jgi:hypothetical protein